MVGKGAPGAIDEGYRRFTGTQMVMGWRVSAGRKMTAAQEFAGDFILESTMAFNPFNSLKRHF